MSRNRQVVAVGDATNSDQIRQQQHHNSSSSSLNRSNRNGSYLATQHNGLLAAAATTSTATESSESLLSSASSPSSFSQLVASQSSNLTTNRMQTSPARPTLANVLENLLVSTQQQQQHQNQSEMATANITQPCQTSTNASRFYDNCPWDYGENMYDEDFINRNSHRLNFTQWSGDVWTIKSCPEIFLRVALVAPIVLLGVLGNLTIIYSMYKFKPFRTKPTNVFILSMAIADLLTSLVCPIAALIKDIYQFYPLGSFICRLEGLVKITCLLVSSYSLIVLSSDWLLSVVKPFRTRITIRQSWLVLSGIWIASVVLAIPLFVWRNLRNRKWLDLYEIWCCEQVNYTKYYWLLVSVVLIFLPTLFMTIVLVVILAQMDKFEAKLRRNSQQSNGSLSISMKYKRRIVKILFTYLLTSIICWTPLQITIIFRIVHVGGLPSWYDDVNTFAQLGPSLTAALNPIIFGFMSQPFRRIVSKLLKFKFLDKIILTNNGKASGANQNELCAMDRANRVNQQQVASSNQQNNSTKHHNQQQQLQRNERHDQQQQTFKAQVNNLGKLQQQRISTTATLNMTATTNQNGSKSSQSKRPSGPFSAIRNSGGQQQQQQEQQRKGSTSAGKRVSFNTPIPLGSHSQAIKQPKAAAAVRRDSGAQQEGNNQQTRLGGQVNTAFDYQDTALDDIETSCGIVSQAGRHQATVDGQSSLPNTLNVNSCSVEREHGEGPLSIVSMHSINIEENLEPPKLQISDYDDDEGNHGGLK